MQRKNYLLKRKSSKTYRDGMAMIMAVGVIVIIATILTFALSLATQTSKRTIDLYIYEQAVLLSKSAAEYALLKISLDNNVTDPCNITNLNFKVDLDNDGSVADDFYDIDISIKYSYINPPASCTADRIYATVTTPEQNGSVLMDITVSVPISKDITLEPIRYFRRSIQKL